MFASFDSKVASPDGTANNYNFRLQDGCPAFGPGNTKFNFDLGAYTIDGKGNKH